MPFNRIQNQLLEIQTRKLVYTAILAFLGVLAVVLLVFLPTGAVMAATGFSIFDFQLAWTSQQMDVILQSWNSILSTVIYQTYLDYLFIGGNVLLFVSIWLLFTQKLRNSKLTRLTRVMMWFAILAGVCDAIENVFTLLILSSPSRYPDFFPVLVSTFATVKFLALFTEIIVLGPTLLIYIGDSRSKRVESQ